MTGDNRSTVRIEAHETPAGLEPSELLIISTKAYDTAEAIVACKSLADEGTMVLSLQNGLGNLESIREWKGRKAFGGTTTMGALLTSPGVVRVSGLGRTVVGSDQDRIGATRIAEAFSACGLPTSVKRNIDGEIWSKAIVNSAINPFAAVLRVPNGKLLESNAVSRLMAETCAECERVASSAGVVLPQRSAYPRARAVARETANNRSSMLQDIERRRRTEIDHINGAFSSLGDSYGVSTPINDALVAMVRTLECQNPTQKG